MHSTSADLHLFQHGPAEKLKISALRIPSV